MKTGKVSKELIDGASKALTELKREYKNVTGSGWKPRSLTAKASAFDDINEEAVSDGRWNTGHNATWPRIPYCN